MDMVAAYVASKPWVLRRNIVLVEGTTDEALFRRADQLSTQAGLTLLGNEISIVAAGQRDRGGTFGVARELITLRSIVPLVLDRQGRPAYRVIGLVDNDHAGRQIIKDVLKLDRAAAEFRDIVTMRPINLPFASRFPADRQRESELANRPYRNLDWEIEDAVSARLIQLFEKRHSDLKPRKIRAVDKTHHEFSKDGKTAFHRIAQAQATLDDLKEVVSIVAMIRAVMGLP
jgi:hypothetical protein